MSEPPTGRDQQVRDQRVEISRVEPHRGQQIGVEAGALTGVAGRSLLAHLDQDGVAVTVQPDLVHPLAVTAGLALHPVFVPASGPEGGPAGGQRAVQGDVVHPADHQHLAGALLLDHGRHQSGRIVLQPRGDLRIEIGISGYVTGAHRSILPSPVQREKGGVKPMTYCAAPRHAPGCVVVVADRTPLSDFFSAWPGTHPGTCSIRPPFNTALLRNCRRSRPTARVPYHRAL